MLALLCVAGVTACVFALDRMTGLPHVQHLYYSPDLRRAVRASNPVLAELHSPKGTLSVSVGLACRSFDDAAESTESFTGEDDESEVLFRAADAALYAAKNGGRDRVHTAPHRTSPLAVRRSL